VAISVQAAHGQTVEALMKLKDLASKRGMLEPLKGEPVYIDNRELSGFIPGFRDRDCRSNDCAALRLGPRTPGKRCGSMRSTVRKLLKLYEEGLC